MKGTSAVSINFKRNLQKIFIEPELMWKLLFSSTTVVLQKTVRRRTSFELTLRTLWKQIIIRGYRGLLSKIPSYQGVIQKRYLLLQSKIQRLPSCINASSRRSGEPSNRSKVFRHFLCELQWNAGSIMRKHSLNRHSTSF